VVEDQSPEIVQPPSEQAVLAPEISSRPQPRPAERVAPEPMAPPEPDVKPDEVTQAEVRKDDAGEVQQEEAEATAPEEAATEIVTEAETPSGAPTRSLRPKARPQQVARAQTEATEQPPKQSEDQRSAIERALAEANATSEPSTLAGPSLTAGERDMLKRAIAECWNVGSLSSEAMRTIVVVAVKMSEDGKPDVGSIRMIASSGGSDASARQAFEAARRTIIRCGASGYNLPKEKFEQWRDIEITFDPKKMRNK
jgi:hypothetical protein